MRILLLRDSVSVLDTALDVEHSGPSRLHDLFVSVEAMTPGEFKAQGKDLLICYGFHAKPFGEYLLATTPRGICSLAFVDPETRSDALNELRTNWQEATLVENQNAGKDATKVIF